ncbi:DUF418 domain-containing protein [Paenibacillus dendritiformis]|uniref:DUF418 domain-containing protein n=1 Tax=Paenibacillus dendritiformis C454 TaxID=1131935 RepID=H3SN25_9BACL|nr:DUF418 domain-containing protein [Paenibacillus dendritiformis]EHQ59510.1 hypothetical protein PDENDC454_24864 [Paenibacillus dendritiformis C454]CAH8770838.1 DUF418 domain-containing protein [Paenibacillus dendritiformis]
MSVSIRLPDESGSENKTESTAKHVADSKNNGLKNNAVLGESNQMFVDVPAPLQDGEQVGVANRDSAEIRNARANSRGAGRLVGLDATRGLAVIGMYLQHFGSNETISAIVSGNTTLLFVLCGGISYSIMARRMMDQGAESTTFRARMLARAVFVDLIGYLLILLNTPYGVILPAYAAMFVLALVLVHRSIRVLVTTAVALTVVAPPLMILGMSVLGGGDVLSDIAGGPMSALAIAPAFVAGMAIGRLDLTKVRTALSLAGGGGLTLAVGKMLSAFVIPGLSRSFDAWLIGLQGTVSAVPTMPEPNAIWPLNTEPPLWNMLLWTSPHSASTFQTLIGLGGSFLVLGLVCLVPKKNSVVLLPFAAVGRVALTMYAVQFVVIWSLELAGIEYGLGGIPYGDFLVAAATLVTGWLIARLPFGPIESLMRHFDRAFSASRTSPYSSKRSSSTTAF